MQPTSNEFAQRAAVLAAIREFVAANSTIKLPAFDRDRSAPSIHAALTSVGIEPNPFGGSVGEFRYQFEGEEDLLHLIVTRLNGERLTAEEGQEVASYVLHHMPPGLVWIRPGDYSQHFYMGHDDLVAHLHGQVD